MKIGKAYKCKEVDSRHIEIFQEDEITPSSNEVLGEPIVDTLVQDEPYL